ncbi:probable nucleoredoxin 1 [Nymphaea colorata]|uniref:probable nucleoredoxin 1 n=1 Tax=Nymphaea colorata TaxID=210225 RepID=UPI00129E39DC|nr:probable nucleoredoxin 1 [Nymphaea colorata]
MRRPLQSGVVEAIEDHGAVVYPFTSERMAEHRETEKSRLASQTIESPLESVGRELCHWQQWSQVSDLVGKTVLLYFSADWDPFWPFLNKLIETYHRIKAKDYAFETIFSSSDHDEAAFEEFGNHMKTSEERLYLLCRQPYPCESWHSLTVIFIYINVASPAK